MLDVRKPFGILFSCGLLSAHALAEDVQNQYVNLKYEVDPTVRGCPNVFEFRSIVAQQLGYDPYDSNAALEVELHVQTTEAGIEGTIDWSTTGASKLGERRFTSRADDCRQMMATAGFVVAVQIQLMATERANTPLAGAETADRSHANPAPGSALQAPTPSVTLAKTSFEVRSRPSVSTGWSATVGLGPSIGFGLAPNAVAQGRLFIALQKSWLELEGGAEASLPSSKRETYGGGFEERLLMGTLAACVHESSISACAVSKLGMIQVRGIGVDRAESPSGLLAQVGLRLAYSVGVSNHFALRGHIEGLYLVTPWTVDLNYLDVWTMPRASALAGIDAAYRF